MASISSMISLFVLLLATYSYSAPIVPEGTATVEYEVINATFILESNATEVPVTSVYTKSIAKSHLHGSTSSEESDSDEVKRHGFTRSPRTYEDSSYATATDLNESSTVEDSSSIVMIPKRGVDVLSFTDATETTGERDIEDSSSSTEINDKRGLEESSDSTVTGLYESSTVEDSSSIVMIPKRGVDVLSFTDATETTGERDIEDSSSSTEINDKRGLEESSDSTVTGLYESSTIEDSSSIVMIPKRGVEDLLFTTIESSTEFNQRAIRPVHIVKEKIEISGVVPSEYQPEMSTDVQPSTSVDSFAKSTGLLRDQPSTTEEYETTTQVEEDSTTELPVTSETATKILSIIPGTISETKVVVNRPAGTPVIIQRVNPKQLSQVDNQTIVEETKSHN